MNDHEYRAAYALIPTLLTATPIGVAAVVALAAPHGIGEEATRLAVWHLTERGEISWADGWMVRTLTHDIPHHDAPGDV